jgi:uncharacterized membrane protein YphA (DoxX/SURF4 family)
MTSAQLRTKKTQPLNIAFWLSQAIPAVMFIMAGIMKTTSPMDQLAISLPWTKDVPELLVRFIGLCEFTAAIGLLLPSILRIKPILTPFAATGLIAIMVSASVFHISRGEYSVLGLNAIIAVIAIFIMWGRFKKIPIKPRN